MMNTLFNISYVLVYFLFFKKDFYSDFSFSQILLLKNNAKIILLIIYNSFYYSYAYINRDYIKEKNIYGHILYNFIKYNYIYFYIKIFFIENLCKLQERTNDKKKI